LTSKIINMAERLKDEADRQLEALFRSAPLPDDGFSSRIVARVRRRVWMRRLALPGGFAVGLLLGARPLAEAFEFLPALAGSLFGDLLEIQSVPGLNLPGSTTVMLGISLVIVAFMATRLLEE